MKIRLLAGSICIVIGILWIKPAAAQFHPHHTATIIDAPPAPATHPATPATQPARASHTAPAVASQPAAAVPAAPLVTPPADSVPVTLRTVVAPNVPHQIRINTAWQIALEAADFSPGILDGHFKRKGLMALTEYAARFFPGASPFDNHVFTALKVDPDDAFAPYTLTDDDAAQVGAVPEDWNEKAKLDRLRYESLGDCIAEKFHCTQGLLQTLNPGVGLNALMPGETIIVPNLRPFPTDNRPVVLHRNIGVSYVTINLTEKTIRLFDKDDKELALFDCSVARDKAKLPARDTAIQAIAAPLPEYWFDPKLWPDVTDVKQKLRIPPGPRNPVGLAWMSLDLPGYGIHGSPKPELIGKTGSHGCFRLTNWDALKFAGLVHEGMTVKIINPEKDGQ